MAELTAPLQAPAGGSAPLFPDFTTGNVTPYRAGFYQAQLVAGGVMVGIRLWRGWGRQDGRDLDISWDAAGNLIVTQTESIERRWCWHASRDNVEVHPWLVWPNCSADEITEDEYLFLLVNAAHARAHRPDDPFAAPRKPVDFNSLRFDFRS